MVALAGLAILHGCIAAAFIEGLMRAWDVQTPGLRLGLRLIALAAPFVSPLLAVLAAPMRQTFEFQTVWSVYAGSTWDNLRIGSVPLSTVATTVMAATGAVLFARDMLPFLADRLRHAERDVQVAVPHPARTRLSAVMDALSVGGSPAAVSITVLATDAAVLYCWGVGRPALAVSTGTLARLDDDELRAAIAHELEHARRRDPAVGWVLMAVRLLQAFNPATQIVGRQVVEEIEHRAD